MNPTHFQTEFRAYQVGTDIDQAMGNVATFAKFGNQFYLLTVRGWSSESTDNAIKYLIRQVYHTSPADKVKTFLRNTKGAP